LITVDMVFSFYRGRATGVPFAPTLRERRAQAKHDAGMPPVAHAAENTGPAPTAPASPPR
jgi:hypothetical protein